MLDGARVAIVLLSALGDVVHAFPLVASLRAAAPRGRIDWVAQPGAPASLAARHPGVDRVLRLDRRRGWRGFRDFRRAVRGEPYDLAVVLQVYGKASLAALLLPARRRLGFDRARAREANWLVTDERIPARRPGHVRDQYLEFADHLGVPRHYVWPIAIGPADRAAQRALPGGDGAPVAALVPTSSDRRKDWPPRRWARLADALSERGYAVVLAGGSGGREERRAGRIVAAARCPVVDLRADDFDRLIRLLDGAALVVAPDTGPYHLAVALGTPALGLFGTTDPARHGPGVRFGELVIDAYHDPGEAWGPPRPERRPGRMERIGVTRVLEAVELARARYPRAAEGPARESEHSA